MDSYKLERLKSDFCRYNCQYYSQYAYSGDESQYNKPCEHCGVDGFVKYLYDNEEGIK